VRYGLTLGAVALGSAAIAGIPLYAFATRLLEQELDERLEATAEVAAVVLAATPPSEVDQLLAAFQEEADLDAVCVLGPDGRLILEATQGPTCEVQPGDRAAMDAALKTDSSHSAIHREPGRSPYVLAFASLATPESPESIVVVRGAAAYFDHIYDLRMLFVAAGMLLFALVSSLGFASSSRLVRPVHRLLEATESLRSGATPPPPHSGGPLELDALESAFADMAESVHERETYLRSLAGAVAHEVRNPSHAIRLHLGLLQRSLPPDDERLAERVQVLTSELDLLDATVEAFLVFARDQAVRRMDVALKHVLERWADGAPVDAPDVRVRIDPALVGRAVSNLVRNAREAGGEPVIRGRVDDVIVIEVEDGGRGFPADIASTAFEPFVSGRAGGSGLGLAIVAAVARGHGGSTSLASVPGRTTVRFTLART
jgi:signal transduction histidine kinase